MAYLVLTISFLISIVFAIYLRFRRPSQISSTCSKIFRWILVLIAAVLIPYTIVTDMVWSATAMLVVVFLGNLIFAIVDIYVERKYRKKRKQEI